MGLRQELKNVFIEKNHSLDEFLSRYRESLNDDGRILLRASAILYGAYCSSPAFNKNRQLDILAEGDRNMRILQVLIRDYDQGVESILDVYDEYFQLKEKLDFWKFFNKKLNLPEDWLEKAKQETNPVGEVPYGTGLDDYGDTPDIYPDDFDDDLNKILDEKGV